MQSSKKQRILITFDDMIADMLSNKRLNSVVSELFIRVRKLNFPLVFMMQPYFDVQKNIRLNSILFCYGKSKKRERQQFAVNHSSDIDFQNFMNLYRKCTAKPYSYLVIDFF